MRANKITLSVTVEVLSIDSVPALLNLAADQLRREVAHGNLVMEDGDTIFWQSESKPVTI